MWSPRRRAEDQRAGYPCGAPAAVGRLPPGRPPTTSIGERSRTVRGGWCETTARLACPRIPAGCVVVGRRTNPVRLPPPPCHPGADDPLADRAPFHTTLLGASG